MLRCTWDALPCANLLWCRRQATTSHQSARQQQDIHRLPQDCSSGRMLPLACLTCWNSRLACCQLPVASAAVPPLPSIKGLASVTLCTNRLGVQHGMARHGMAEHDTGSSPLHHMSPSPVMWGAWLCQLVMALQQQVQLTMASHKFDWSSSMLSSSSSKTPPAVATRQQAPASTLSAAAACCCGSSHEWGDQWHTCRGVITTSSSIHARAVAHSSLRLGAPTCKWQRCKPTAAPPTWCCTGCSRCRTARHSELLLLLKLQQRLPAYTTLQVFTLMAVLCWPLLPSCPSLCCVSLSCQTANPGGGSSPCIVTCQGLTASWLLSNRCSAAVHMLQTAQPKAALSLSQ